MPALNGTQAVVCEPTKDGLVEQLGESTAVVHPFNYRGAFEVFVSERLVNILSFQIY